MNIDLYIYYRVRAADAETFHRKAIAMQQMLRRQHGVDPALKRRPDPTDDADALHTWMEVYPAVPPDFLHALDRAAAEHGLLAFIEGARHTEQFVDVSTCA